MRGNIAPGGYGEARISNLFWDAVPGRYDPRFMNIRIANSTTITMITISTTVLSIASLLGRRAMNS